MKKSVVLLCILMPVLLVAQVSSWEGKGISPKGTLFCLNIFVNVIYDIHPEYNQNFVDSTYWAPVTEVTLEGINNTSIPKYLLDWMDTMYIPHGTCTRLYGEASFDSLQIIGDFIVVNIRESTIIDSGGFDRYGIPKAAIKMINAHGFETLFHHNSYNSYDMDGNDSLDFVNIFIRNITSQYGGLNSGSGYNRDKFDSIYIGSKRLVFRTVQCVGTGNITDNPTNIIIHELSHSLFGGNDFHTSGGNHRGDGCMMPFLNIQCGYGLMGAAHSGLVCCNGYERWRMHWKHPQSVDFISARDAANTQSVVSDVTREDGNQTFLLRDFVTYGDAVRIKLPYKDSMTSSNQYIWLENHQVGDNNKLDFLQYSNTHSCRPQGTAGIYAYYQIGRDVLVGTDSEVWDSYHRDNLKTIPAEGYYDYRMNPTRWGFFQNAKPQRPEDLIEYDFDKSPTMQIPADWNWEKLRVVAFVSRPITNYVNGFTDMYVNNADVFTFKVSDGVDEVVTDPDAVPVEYYDIMGRRHDSMQPGINIVKMSDGSSRKVLVK